VAQCGASGRRRPSLQGNERLLRLHESGLPTWAIYLPQYGVFYRPWLRTLTWLLFYAFSIVSFLIGFFDLYKAVPGLQPLVQRLAASLWLPPTAVLDWLEHHTQIRRAWPACGTCPGNCLFWPAAGQLFETWPTGAPVRLLPI
jgi:hypothetical protein